MIDASLFDRLGLTNAVRDELALRNSLLPRRWDYEALSPHHEEVAKLLSPRLRRAVSGQAASVVLSAKGWRGVRPIHVMTLPDRSLYRAAVELISASLPPAVTQRVPFEIFNKAPLGRGTRYVSKSDVAAYYEFVDHVRLADELIAQTGEEPAVDLLTGLLGRVMGRRVGLPQVNTASNVLGDTYIDIARRRLARRGYAVFTYSDDFRIASKTLADARGALEACAEEVRELGLVLNERKTFTYGAQKYERSLTAFADAERDLFATEADEGDDEDPFALGALGDDYDTVDEDGPPTLGATPLDHGIDDDEAFDDANLSVDDDLDPRRVGAARRAWEIWEAEDESEEAQAGQVSAITQSLLGRALPTLGAAGDAAPINSLSELLRFEPALAPQVAAYIAAYAKHGFEARREVRTALNKVVGQNIFSAWQGMWLAQAAGEVQRTQREQPYEVWLARSAADVRHDGLAATAAGALGRLGRKTNANVVAATVDRVGEPWRQLAFWGLIGLDNTLADDVADNAIDRLLLSATDS